MKPSLLRLALEEAANGAANQEIEHVFYARLNGNRELFEKAAGREFQEQWEIKVPRTEENKAEGRIRVRHTAKTDGTEQYVLTTKTAGDGKLARLEVAIPTTKDHFKQFKMMANGGMKKVRFFFPIQGSELVWEIDMFVNDPVLTAEECLAEGATFREWCKIDLEVKDRTALVPPLPIHFEEIITKQMGERTPEEEQHVRSLYESIFTIKH